MKPADGIGKRHKENLVSVIIPTFNRDWCISIAINSVHNQTYRPIECIVVDDGSTDKTEKIVESLKEQLNSTNFQIIYLKQPNSGSQSARNYGTQQSNGEFIQYLDSDDILYPEKFSYQVAYLKENNECDGTYGDWEKGTPKKKETIKGPEGNDLILDFFSGKPIHTLSLLFRRRAIEMTGKWDTEIKRNQEIDYHIRGILNGCKYRYSPILTGLWHLHNFKRITNSTGLGHLLLFYKKEINNINAQNQLSALKEKIIGTSLFWQTFPYLRKNDKIVEEALVLAKSLNKSLPTQSENKFTEIYYTYLIDKSNKLMMVYYFLGFVLFRPKIIKENYGFFDLNVFKIFGRNVLSLGLISFKNRLIRR